jgi:predicted transcriptional regulator
VIIFVAAVPKTQAYALKITYTIGIHEDGTASWVIEVSTYLQTEDDQTSFRQLITRAITYIDQFASNVTTIVNQAQNMTGRFMMAERIATGGNVTKSDVGAYGFLRYSFDWTNFAVVENTKITIGDAFSNESFIFRDGGLSVLLPTGYEVKSCSPSPDYDLNNLLKWNAVSSLRDGQPTILLSRTEGTSFLPAFPVLFDLLLTITGAVLASIVVLRIRKKKKESTPIAIPDEAIKEAGDVERILAVLEKGGGQVLQSKITEQLKFSKAKTSRILGDMENKGIIERHKSGRNKVVSPTKRTRQGKRLDS